MSEVYHLNGTPTGPRRLFAQWDLEAHKAPTGWAWHTCNGTTLAAAGTTRTRTGARTRARLFALIARWHRPRQEPARHMVITLKSGIQIRLPTNAYRVRTNPLTGALANLTIPAMEIARVRLDHPPVAAIHNEPAGEHQ